MSSFSDYLEDALLDHVFGSADYTPPLVLYVALFTAAPTDAGGGTEVSGGAYARAIVTNNTTNFPAASGGSKSNGIEIAFPQATALWGDVVAVGIFDASTGGNMLAWADITSQTVPANATLRIASGALTITLD